MEYSPQEAKVWPGIVEYLWELFPDAEEAGIINLGAIFVVAQSGQRLMLGTTDDAQPAAANRGMILGPDLASTDPRNLRKVFFGCMPSQMPTILNEGIEWESCNVAKYKYLGAAHPKCFWTDDQKERLGETFTSDDAGNWFCVLEGRHILNPEGGRCNLLWEKGGVKDSKGVLRNQQWVVKSDSITWEWIHFHKVTKTVLCRDPITTMQAEMRWTEAQWLRRYYLATDVLEMSDIPSLLGPGLVQNLVCPALSAAGLEPPPPWRVGVWLRSLLRSQGMLDSLVVERAIEIQERLSHHHEEMKELAQMGALTSGDNEFAWMRLKLLASEVNLRIISKDELKTQNDLFRERERKRPRSPPRSDHGAAPQRSPWKQAKLDQVRKTEAERVAAVIARKRQEASSSSAGGPSVVPDDRINRWTRHKPSSSSSAGGPSRAQDEVIRVEEPHYETVSHEGHTMQRRALRTPPTEKIQVYLAQLKKPAEVVGCPLCDGWNPDALAGCTCQKVRKPSSVQVVASGVKRTKTFHAGHAFDSKGYSTEGLGKLTDGGKYSKRRAQLYNTPVPNKSDSVNDLVRRCSTCGKALPGYDDWAERFECGHYVCQACVMPFCETCSAQKH
jgi:hypothetical protein